MAASPFDEILVRFQRAYAKYDRDELFGLCALTRAEYDTDRTNVDRDCGYVGFVPVGNNKTGATPGYMIFGPKYRKWWLRQRKVANRSFPLFCSLAARAGASLPLRLRKTIPFEPADPTAWWLAFLWWRKPPSEADLLPLKGKKRASRIIWDSPFLESIEAIETAQLCSEAVAAQSTQIGVRRRRGRPPKSGPPTKVDRAVREMLNSGDVEKYGRQWKQLAVRYGDKLPVGYKPDALRRAVERAEKCHSRTT